MKHTRPLFHTVLAPGSLGLVVVLAAAVSGCGPDWRRSLDVRGVATEAAARKADHEAFERAMEASTSQAFEEYLARFPGGIHEDEARRALEEASWREARAAGTEEAALAFRERFPRSRHAAEASEHAARACYRAAIASRDPMKIRAAFSRYPGHPQAAPALRFAEELELHAAKTSSDPLVAVRFLLEYPTHPQREAVEQRLADMERVLAQAMDRPLIYALWLVRFWRHAEAANIRKRLGAMPPSTQPVPSEPTEAWAKSDWVTAARCVVAIARAIRALDPAKDVGEAERLREDMAVVFANPATGAQCSRELVPLPQDPLARAALEALGSLGLELDQLRGLVAGARENGELLRAVIVRARTRAEEMERQEVVGDALGENQRSGRLSEVARLAAARASAGASLADNLAAELAKDEQQLAQVVLTLLRYATWALDTRQ